MQLLTPVSLCHALGHVMSNVSFAAVAVSFTHTIKGTESFTYHSFCNCYSFFVLQWTFLVILLKTNRWDVGANSYPRFLCWIIIENENAIQSFVPQWLIYWYALCCPFCFPTGVVMQQKKFFLCLDWFFLLKEEDFY